MNIIKRFNYNSICFMKNKHSITDIWEHIISMNKIDLTKYIQVIHSSQIKKSRKTWNGKDNQFEPRLLCKMDTSFSRPKIFKENNISMFSLKNGVYALIKEDIYVHLNTYYIAPMKIEDKTNSLLLKIGNSESTMLDKLYYNHILNDIIGEKIIYGPFLIGRHRCNFDTIIGSTLIKIRGCQYETDGCYETNNYICIIEAKTVKCKDFNIRQLYFPFREVYKIIENKKKIICLFIYKDKKDNSIHIYKYKWNDYKRMLDIENIGYYKYYL